jgi:GGDEF domain-containing protein
MDHGDFDIAGEYETLLQFLYVAPVGLVQIDAAGEIAMINPLSAQLLMPLTRDAGLGNLFTALQGVAPVDAWLKRADQALYRAKAEGRDRIVCAVSG